MTGRATVRFVLDEQIVELSDVPPTLTVLEYLREVRGRTGTKEGCAEGDCGACTVVLGELSRDRSRIDYRAINSCIRFLPTIDGKALVTVESLQASQSLLHPVQQALVDHHGSQCGFCTPGFVMSLFGLYLNEAAPSRDAVVTALAGNLCRCTGYKPIIAAGCAMTEYPEPAEWNRADAQSPARIERLRGVQSGSALALPGFHAPTTLDRLAELLEIEPGSVLLAGGTDVGLWVTKQQRALPSIIYLGAVAELQEIRQDAAGLRIGAAVPLTEAWRAIVELHPELQELALRFASPPVCNSGTLCGNIANGSPIGDAMPILIALDAQLELRQGRRSRRLPLDEFYLGYQRKDLRPGEFLSAVNIPSSPAAQRIASYKVSKRFDQDISAVCAGFAISLDDQRVTAARLAFGGMAATPARARKAEAALLNQKWQPQTVEAAVLALNEDFRPLTDLRASSHYRLLVAGQLLRRFYRESQGNTAASLRQIAPVAELS
ncbi:MAG TPA: xanthine dehydrogenase small subunit [Steroidobacter sp.]